MSTLCWNKAWYDTMAEAKAARNRRQPYERERLYAYKCQDPDCPYYHLTRKRPPTESMREPKKGKR